MSHTNRNISNFSWLLITRIFRILISTVVSIWTARYLGPTDYGLLNYVLAIIALFSILSTLGIEQIFVRRLLEKTEDENYLLGSAFLLKLIGALLLIVISFTIAMLKDESGVFILLITFISFSYVFKAFDVIQFWFEAHMLSKKSSRVNLYVIVLSSAFKILLILFGANLVWFGISVLFEALIISIGLIFIYIKEKSIFTWKISNKLMKRLLINAWPLILAGVLYNIYTKIDQIMLGDMINNSTVGIYVAAVTLSQGWLFLPGIVGKAFYPQMINSKKISREKYLQTTQHLLNLIALVAISVSLIMTFSSSSIILLLYGKNYSLSGYILALHIWGGVFTAMSTISYRYFIAENLQKTSFYRGVVGLVVNIILNLILIPKYGGFGAAVATVFSLAFSLYLFNILTKSTREMFLMQTKALFLYDSINSIKHIKEQIRMRNSH